MNILRILTGSSILAFFRLFTAIVTTPIFLLPNNSTSASEMVNYTIVTQNETYIETSTLKLNMTKPLHQDLNVNKKSSNRITTKAPRVLTPEQLAAIKLAETIYPDFDKIQKNGVLLQEYQPQPNPMDNSHQRTSVIGTSSNVMRKRGERLTKFWIPTSISQGWPSSQSKTTGEKKSSGCEAVVTFEVDPWSLVNVDKARLKLHFQPNSEANSSDNSNSTRILLYGAFELKKNDSHPVAVQSLRLIESFLLENDKTPVTFQITNYIQSLPLVVIGKNPRIKIIFTLKRACEFEPEKESGVGAILTSNPKSTNKLSVLYRATN